MGTRGLVFIRCRGRYFVYYNQYDSYPEGLGEAIVAEIPEDPEKYREWLKLMRKAYSDLALQFEEKHLPVAVEVGQESRDISACEEYAKCYLAVDDRLECPPTQTMEGNTLNLFIEFTYTIDLDREVLIIDDGATFKLSKIPREEVWIKYLSVDNRRRRVLHQDTPSDIIGTITYEPNVDNKAKARYSELSIEVVSPKAGINAERAPRQKFLMFTYWATRKIYGDVLDRSASGWKPEDFSFREIAFAILSLATGEVAFECPDVLDRNYLSEGYFLIPEERLGHNQQKLLPRFLRESHLPGVESGSAPQSTMYWFGNVLVYLASRLDLVDLEEASVATVVDSGLDQGLKHFHAMVFSILDFVLIQVHVDKDGKVHVQRSPLMTLFYFDDKNSRYSEGPRSRNLESTQDSSISSDPTPLISNTDEENPGNEYPSLDLNNEHESEDDEDDSDDEDYNPDENDDESDDESDEEYVYYEVDDDEKNPEQLRKEAILKKERGGFVAMMNFFDVATDQRLAGAKSHKLPNEIMTAIMQFSDTQTYNNLAKISPCCREMSYRKYRPNNDYEIVGMSPENTEEFVFENRHTGEIFHSTCGYGVPDYDLDYGMHDPAFTLNPVVGVADANRMSLMSSVNLNLPGIPQKDTSYLNKKNRPVREGYYWSSARDTEGLIFKLPEYAYPGLVEKAWGKYLIELLVGKDKSGFLSLSTASYRCLLPPRYRQLKIEPITCGEIQAWVRCSQDESPEEWEKVQRYAVESFSNREQLKQIQGMYRGLQGCLVIIAFGTNVKLFYYMHHKSTPPPVSVGPNAYNSQILASITDPDPMHRLIQLIPGDESLDLLNSEAREKLESWIKVFGKRQPDMEYDPISEQYIPIIRDDKEEKDEQDGQGGAEGAGDAENDGDASADQAGA
ncbi:hypothetical protein ASPWEDRAFT_123520 [Aspergillus wentii DTO 134E9]|uniref:Uncharacterized protein n=1 Tax=Aspergillus wentii DTO 134E9 TaxID=1073089 RepID=A0A1L9S016_ASPWE|nr:uncharacterized protein ASPWEDRAFT_123520 [Aspergillus wentii DTO 134E9]OJJ40529.1 hypothetical protein ASPWEDRAFT_123520 [Aspergillus wentii DTO 134E9]